jgi:hypothetical protein
MGSNIEKTPDHLPGRDINRPSGCRLIKSEKAQTGTLKMPRTKHTVTNSHPTRKYTYRNVPRRREKRPCLSQASTHGHSYIPAQLQQQICAHLNQPKETPRD